MLGEIIAIGDELTSGRVTNTTSGFAARHLFAAGHEVLAMLTIGDRPDLIGEALLRAVARADFVIVTGGLGATSDDLTNEAAAQALGLPMEVHSGLLQRIRTGSDLPPGEPQERMARLPLGAVVLSTNSRMAGHLLVHNRVPVFFLPGVPEQMRELLQSEVLPRLAELRDDDRSLLFVRQRLFKLFGPGENTINGLLRELESQERLRIGYYPVGPETHVSLTVLADTEAEAADLFASASRRMDALLGSAVFGYDQDTMASVVGALLLAQGVCLGTAESCTGGLIAREITRTPGSSAWFNGGVVAYANQLKEDLLGVGRAVLAEHGAVSAATVRAMASGVVERGMADIGVAVSGIAGPSGGSPEKPVGTVFIGLAAGAYRTEQLFQFHGDREQIQARTALQALNMVRHYLLSKL